MRSCYHMPLTNKGATTNVIQLAIIRNSQRRLPRPGMLGCILTTNNSTCKVAFAATWNKIVIIIMMIITMMIKLSLCEPSRLVEGIPSVNDIFFLLCCYKKNAKECSSQFYDSFFRSYRAIMDRSQVEDCTEIIVWVIPQQSARLNIKKKLIVPCSAINFQSSFRMLQSLIAHSSI